MKNPVTLLYLIVAFVSFGVYAQEEAVLIILDNESNRPICRFFDQMKINSNFIPEGRIGNIETTPIEDVRNCEEEDVWDAVEEEMLVGMAVGVPSSFLFPFESIVSISTSTIIGCGLGYLIQWDKANNIPVPQLSERITVHGIVGGVIGGLLNYLLTIDQIMNKAVAARIGLSASSAIIAGEVCKDISWSSE